MVQDGHARGRQCRSLHVLRCSAGAALVNAAGRWDERDETTMLLLWDWCWRGWPCGS